MKKLMLITAFCITNIMSAMKQPDTPFAQEGLVERDRQDMRANVIWISYDEYLIQGMLIKPFKEIIEKQQPTIIKRKFGATFLEYFNQHIKTGYPFCMLPIIRYSHAVCWRLLGDSMMGRPETDDNLQRAERQIPLDVAELRFIILGEDNYATKTSCDLINEFKNKSHADQRKHLNEYLNTMKERTLSQQ